MTKEESFEAKEQKGRGIFAAFAAQQNIRIQAFSEDKYAKWDVAYKYKGIKIAGEIKVRNNASDEYPTYMLQVDKLQALQAMTSKRTDLRCHYINHFTDNLTYIWDITDLNLEDFKIEKKWLPKNDYDNTLVEKEVIYLCKTTTIISDFTDQAKSIFNEMKDSDDNEIPLPF